MTTPKLTIMDQFALPAETDLPRCAACNQYAQFFVTLNLHGDHTGAAVCERHYGIVRTDITRFMWQWRNKRRTRERLREKKQRKRELRNLT